ncbi:IS66 family insertion sequence element accessory protein TnpA [Microbulbifer variabilis]|uniref:IS66 family insertion sequence element accessory protein TnpA n=1 Tax=Microbulbifer variabilis TaxID=266805 RepID=UPI003F4A0DE8
MPPQSTSEKSSQSKRANARNHNQNYNQFLYWYRKLFEQGSVPNTLNLFPRVSSPPQTLREIWVYWIL